MRRKLWPTVLLSVALLLATADASAARRVAWTQVAAPAIEHPAQIAHALRRRLVRASRHAKWGHGPRLELSARITDLTWERQQDVLRVSLTVVAKIAGGKGARSHIRLGGRPDRRRKLLRQALQIVSGGLVTRLAEIARKAAHDR